MSERASLPYCYSTSKIQFVVPVKHDIIKCHSLCIHGYLYFVCTYLWLVAVTTNWQWWANTQVWSVYMSTSQRLHTDDAVHLKISLLSKFTMFFIYTHIICAIIFEALVFCRRSARLQIIQVACKTSLNHCLLSRIRMSCYENFCEIHKIYVPQITI